MCMKQVLGPLIEDYKTILIRQNTPTLEYLKKHNTQFRLQQVNHEQFCMLQNHDKVISMNYKNFIAGYGELKGNHFRSSGGLKISDPEEKINGSFIIEGKRIIFDATCPFYQERDAYVYGGYIYYTEMSMLDILKEELNRKRKLLIYMGEELDKQKYRCNDLFEEVSKEELLEYAIDPSKGEQALERRIHLHF